MSKPKEKRYKVECLLPQCVFLAGYEQEAVEQWFDNYTKLAGSTDLRNPKRTTRYAARFKVTEIDEDGTEIRTMFIYQPKAKPSNNA